MSNIPIDPALASLSEAANDPDADMLEMDMSGFVQDFTKQNEDDTEATNETLQSLHSAAELDRKRPRDSELDSSHLDAGPSHADMSAFDNGGDGGFTTVLETGEDGDDDDDDEDAPPSKRSRAQHPDGVPGGFTLADKDGDSGRRKIRIEYIGDKSRRHITFSKRKAGIMKKAYELSTLTGTQVLLLVVSETGLVYTFTTAKLQPLVTKAEGKNLIQACLNAPDGMGPDGLPTTGPVPATSRGKNGNGLAIRPHKLTPAATAQLAASAQSAQGLHPNPPPSQNDVVSPNADSSIAGRPRKRLPSGKGKKVQGNSQEPPPPMPDALPTADLVPPPLDLHRQGGQSPHVLSSMQSPLSATFGHHMPQDYQQQNGYYQPPQGQQQDFANGYVYQQQQHQQQQFMNLQQQQQQNYANYQREEHARMVLQQQQQDRQRLGIQ